jgi:hypothetical protein
MAVRFDVRVRLSLVLVAGMLLAGCADAASGTPGGPPPGSSSAGSSSPGSSSPGASSPGAPAAPGCPATPPQLATPGGVLPGRSAPLFPDGVLQLAVCVYPVTGGAPARRVVSGVPAATLARQVDALPSQNDGPCPADAGPSVVLIPVTASGAGDPVVGEAGGCGRLTNGTGTRFGRTLVASIAGGS